jgi:hypothetical protein
MKDKNITAERVGIAFEASCFRDELDALLQKYNAHMGIGWDGKWAKVQVLFPQETTKLAVTIMETAKGKFTRYVLREEEVK